MNTQVIAFDVYNTLAYRSPNAVRPFEVQEMLERFGVHASYQAINIARESVFLFDAPKREIHGYVDFLALQFDRMGLHVNLDVIESIAAMYERRDEMILFDDALPAIDAARAKGMRVVTFTTLPKFMLGAAGDALLPTLDRYFDISAAGFVKGDPRFYHAITTALDVPPESIACVGDDPIGDCQVPHRIGWRPTWLNRKNNMDIPDFTKVTSLTEFVASL